MFNRYAFFLLIFGYVIVGYELFRSEPNVTLSFEKTNLENITKPIKIVKITKEKKADASHGDEVVNISVEEEEKKEAANSSIAESYQEIKKVDVDQKTRKYNIFFKEPLKDYISVLFIGGQGKVNLEDTYIQYEDGEIVPAKNLNESYFEKDWYRFESGGKPIQSIMFKGKSESRRGQIALYIQKNLRR